MAPWLSTGPRFTPRDRTGRSGDKIVQVFSVDLDWTYDITLTGTDQVMIHAVDNIDGTMADCVGSLDTERSTCEIIDTQL